MWLASIFRPSACRRLVVAVLLSAACLTDRAPAADATLDAGLPPESLYQPAQDWTDDQGDSIQLASLRGTPVILTMFYTSCSSICPATLRKLQEIQAALVERHLTAKFVLISYDAYGDTPKQLARYRAVHELPRENWLILRGRENAVAHLASRVGLGGYTDMLDHFVHAYRIVVLNDDGVIVKTLDQQHNDVASLFGAGWP